MTETKTTPAGSEGPPGEPVPQPRRRRLVSAAVAFLLVGLAILVYVGWQYYGTDVVSGRRHERIAAELHEQWKNPTVVDVLGPGTAPALGSATGLIRIPKFGRDFEVPLIEGVRDEDLSKGIGHFPGAAPGQLGNFAVAGNRVTHGEPLDEIERLRPGDEVIVETSDATYTYRLDTNPNHLNVLFSDTWVIDPIPVPPPGQAPTGMPRLSGSDPTEAILTLTTCSELFHTDRRLVAFGHLVNIQRT